MSKEPRNLPASIHTRLRNIASSQGRLFQEILQYYGMERFLYRVASSKHANKFVLKGGLIFFAWKIDLRRPTIDIDFLGHTDNSTNNLIRIIGEICETKVEPDGLQFNTSTIQVDQIQEAAQYQGTRIRLVGNLGSVRIPMRIDISFADEVIPAEIEIEYPTLLDFPSPKMRGYTYESAIAEKLQAIVVLGSINSRMKDYFDIWLLSQEVEFDGLILQKAIETTFRHRKTEIPNDLPSGLSDEFARASQRQWAAFLRRPNLSLGEFNELNKVVEVLQELLQPILVASNENRKFKKKWKTNMGWK